jgi:hypothetical protein
MRSQCFCVLFSVIATLGLCPISVEADQVRIDLPELQGEYNYGNHSSKTSLKYLNDIYTDISDVSLELTGTCTQGMYRVTALPSITDPPYWDYSWSGILGASLVSNDMTLVEYPAVYLTPCRVEYEGTNAEFQATVPFQKTAFDGFDDFSNTTINWTKVLNSDENNLILSQEPLMNFGSVLTAPKFNLTNVALIFNATPVPEPSTLCLFLCGAIGIVVFRRF